MGYLSRDDILGAGDVQFVDVEVPEWGGTVRVRSLTGIERDAFEDAMIDRKGRLDKRNATAKFLAACIVDEDGDLLFTKADVDQLGGRSAAALMRVFKAATELNGIDDAALEAAEGN